ncbi:hypothetical protein M407DRAFT_122830 [Tulasnella calospora MUT 4182]|uniref:Uncharacterized protein n=1 Tax=Tulasnella calospora MUT 4182 TaxID=1051891 RepID=A0A0C3QAL4_9AGAM|nr:hypothetical protein M407DRAFT_122830 [Tulasnella calospora MUT 4182]
MPKHSLPPQALNPPSPNMSDPSSNVANPPLNNSLPPDESIVQPGVQLYEMPPQLDGILTETTRVSRGGFSDVSRGEWRQVGQDEPIAVGRTVVEGFSFTARSPPAPRPRFFRIESQLSRNST